MTKMIPQDAALAKAWWRPAPHPAAAAQYAHADF